MSLIAVLLLASCASAESKHYVSPAEYDGYSCEQLDREMQRISSLREQAISKDQSSSVFDTALKAYAISQGSYLTNSRNTELDALNNTYSVLDRLITKEGC